MNNRPRSVTVISCVFAAAGVIGLAYHLTEFKVLHPFQYGIVWVVLVRLMAIICGVYMFRGSNWARWLTLVWIAYHVILSGFHSMDELVMPPPSLHYSSVADKTLNLTKKLFRLICGTIRQPSWKFLRFILKCAKLF